MTDADDAAATTDHDAIRGWAEERDARPVRAEQASDPDEPSLDFQFPERDDAERVTPTNWPEFFETFDGEGLVFVPGEGDAYEFVRAEDADDPSEEVREAARARSEERVEEDVERDSEMRASEAEDEANADAHRDEPPFGG